MTKAQRNMKNKRKSKCLQLSLYALLMENALLRSLNQVIINSSQMNRNQSVGLTVGLDPMNTFLPRWVPELQ